MALKIKTRNPQLLLESIKHLIDDGNVCTWSYDNEGDFTHTVDQWKNKAWFTPYTFENDGVLFFGILGRKDVYMTKEEFSVYHGRFIEMILSYFITDIDELEVISPMRNNFDTKNIDF